MRIVVATAVIIASISSASAQFAMDHGHAADAAKAARASALAAAAKAAAIATGAPLLPSQSTDFSVNGHATIQAAPARTAEQMKVDEEAQATWQARCRPAVVEDRDGMRRTKYAESDCDLSRFNTAGTQ